MAITQLHPVLTIQDYFKHFPKFFSQPLLLTSEERYYLALSLISSTHKTNHPNALRLKLDITQLPVFQPLIKYSTNEFTNRLRTHKYWRAQDINYKINRDTFQSAVTDTCWKMIQWAKKELCSNLFNFFEAFQAPEYTDDYQRPWEEFARLSKHQNWSQGVEEAQRATLKKILDDYQHIFNDDTAAQSITKFRKELDTKPARLQKFFDGFKALCPEFAYKPEAYPPSEFRRLMKQIVWPYGSDAKEKNQKSRRDFNVSYGTFDCWMCYGRISIPAQTKKSEKQAPANNLDNNPHTHGHSEEQKSIDIETVEFDLTKAPLALFFQKFSDRRYTYRSRSPIEEFNILAKHLMNELRFHEIAADWIKTIPNHELYNPNHKLNNPNHELYNPTSRRQTPCLSFYKAEIHRELQDQFYQAIEYQFNWFVDIQSRKRGLNKYEYLVLYFELDTGDQISDNDKNFDMDAHRRRLLSEVKINIYDFLDHQQALLLAESGGILPQASLGDDGQNYRVRDIGPIRGPHKPIKPSLKIPTKFSTDRELGIYSEITGRVFNMHAAMSNGTLMELLRIIGIYFNDVARMEYLDTCEENFAKTEELCDSDVMLILKVEEFYNKIKNGFRGRKRLDEDETEAHKNLAKYSELFDAARDISLAKLTSDIWI